MGLMKKVKLNAPRTQNAHKNVKKVAVNVLHATWPLIDKWRSIRSNNNHKKICLVSKNLMKENATTALEVAWTVTRKAVAKLALIGVRKTVKNSANAWRALRIR